MPLRRFTMGNFFSQYRREEHSCTPEVPANAPEVTTGAPNNAPEGSVQKPEKKPRIVRQELHCSSRDRTATATARQQQLFPKSYAMDKSKASFLDLPAELRNNVYSRLLICEDYVRLTVEHPTKVLSLVLLRTCKQVHDEGASVFYAGNSFYCEKRLRIAPRMKLSLPEGPEDNFPPWIQSTILSAGNLLFPSSRYHIWLIRLTIDTTVSWPEAFHNVLTDQKNRKGQYEFDMKMFEELSSSFCKTYERIKALWEEKDIDWDGRMVGLLDHHAQQVAKFTISFSGNEEDECATKGALRRWD